MSTQSPYVENRERFIQPFFYETIYLKLITEEDLPYTLEWRNHYRQWFNDSNQIEFINHKKWFDRYQQSENEFIFIVMDKKNNRIGQASIYDIDWNKMSGEFGRFVVNPSFAGLGHMKMACMAMLKLSYDLLQMQSIHLQVKKNNEKAIHIYQSCGFHVSQLLENGCILMMHMKA